MGLTLPETNIASENRPLKKEIPIGNHHFQARTVSFREGIDSCHVSKFSGVLLSDPRLQHFTKSQNPID